MIDINQYERRKVVAVDEEDRELGVVGLVEAHRGRGIKHRALSLCLYREDEKSREWLVQRRSEGKIVFPGLWANTCCYNLAPGENYLEAAVKRVREERGIEIGTEILRVVGRFSYFVRDEGSNFSLSSENYWCENEVDTVIVGKIEGEIGVKPNPEEVQDWRWVKEVDLAKWRKEKPDEWAPWFEKVWEVVNST